MAELQAALLDASVGHIEVAAGARLVLSSDTWPSPVHLRHQVALTGAPDADGAPPYGQHPGEGGPRAAGTAGAAGGARYRWLLARPDLPLLTSSPPASHPAVRANQLAELVVVGRGGRLRLRSLFLDDCLLPAMPLLCLAVGRHGGALSFEDLTLGDARCSDIGASVATDSLLKVGGAAHQEHQPAAPAVGSGGCLPPPTASTPRPVPVPPSPCRG